MTMNMRRLMSLVMATAFALTMASGMRAQPTQNPGNQLSKVRLMKLLLLNDSSQQELVQAVNQKGVDFTPTPQDEKELREAGASDDLIAAVRANYRGNGATNGPAAPMDSSQSSTSAPQAATNPQTGYAPPQPMNQPPGNYQPGPANNQRPAKKSFFDKLNDALQAASAINAVVQSTRKTRGGLGEPDASVSLTAGVIVNTAWSLLSMTASGATEKPIKNPSDVRFCDGRWMIRHADGTRQSGTYQLEGNRLIMKSADGSLFSDSEMKQDGNEMTLDDGKYVLRLKYRGGVKCTVN
jgi:hypothetical protein